MKTSDTIEGVKKAHDEEALKAGGEKVQQIMDNGGLSPLAKKRYEFDHDTWVDLHFKKEDGTIESMTMKTGMLIRLVHSEDKFMEAVSIP